MTSQQSATADQNEAYVAAAAAAVYENFRQQDNGAVAVCIPPRSPDVAPLFASLGWSASAAPLYGDVLELFEAADQVRSPEKAGTLNRA